MKLVTDEETGQALFLLGAVDQKHNIRPCQLRTTLSSMEVTLAASLQQFYCECPQDGAVVLKLNDCVVIRNMNLHLEEPFDHLLACVHQLLTLQPQKPPGEDSSTAGDAFGFTFSEEQDVRVSADEIYYVVSYCIRNISVSCLPILIIDSWRI